MKISKYIFHLPAANRKISTRMGIPPLTDTDLFTLHTLNNYPLHTSRNGVLRHAQRCYHPISYNSIVDSFVRLRDAGLIDITNDRGMITTKGREWLGGVRMYLVNKRVR